MEIFTVDGLIMRFFKEILYDSRPTLFSLIGFLSELQTRHYLLSLRFFLVELGLK